MSILLKFINRFNVIPIKIPVRARHQWFMPIILATQEAEISRITVQSQPRQIVQKTLSRKPSPKK
jgi:hypothetical protein